MSQRKEKKGCYYVSSISNSYRLGLPQVLKENSLDILSRLYRVGQLFLSLLHLWGREGHPGTQVKRDSVMSVDSFEEENQLENGLARQAGGDGWEESTEPAAVPRQSWVRGGDVRMVTWHRRWPGHLVSLDERAGLWRSL